MMCSTFPSKTIHTFKKCTLYFARQQLFLRNQACLFKCVAHQNRSRSRSRSIHSKSHPFISFCVESREKDLDLDNPDLKVQQVLKSSSLRRSYLYPLLARTFYTSHVSHHHADEKSRTCWKCGADTHPAHELFFCECGVVQKPAEELTYFDLFQMTQTFDLDLKKLGKLYRDTQHRLHPDRFSTKSSEEQAYAEEQSALLNKAYFTLLKPLSRAIYMLELVNITIEENASYSDPDFLMDIMTINEKISTASSADEIDQLDEMNEEKVNECVKNISESLKNDAMSDAKNHTIKLRYYTTIQERIKELRIKNLG